MQIREKEAWLAQRISEDALYQQLHIACLKAEKDYYRIREQLSPSDADALEHYISLCEEIDHRRLTIALSAEP